jgi:hypothetical protein
MIYDKIISALDKKRNPKTTIKNKNGKNNFERFIATIFNLIL